MRRLRIVSLRKVAKKLDNDASRSLSLSQPLNRDQLMYQGNIFNNNNTITSDVPKKCAAKEAPSHPLKLHPRGSIRSNPSQNFASKVTASADCPETKSRIQRCKLATKASTSGNDALNTASVSQTRSKVVTRRVHERSSSERLYSLDSADFINGNSVDNSSSDIGESRHPHCTIRTRAATVNSNRTIDATNEQPSYLPTESSYLLKRGKRTLSSTRIKRDRSDEKNVKLLKKHSVIRSLSLLYSNDNLVTKVPSGTQVKEAASLTDKASTSKKSLAISAYARPQASVPAINSTSRTSQVKTTNKTDLQQTHIVLRLRKR